MRKQINLFLLLLFFSVFNGKSQSLSLFFDEADAFFKTYVSKGLVDYEALVQNSEGLNKLMENAAGLSVSFANTNEYRAFWINAYNLAVIKGVVENYPLKSPLDVAGFFDRNIYSLAGIKITLNDIENKLLRAKFNDARIHFVLVCGAKGCPPLINRAYKPSNVEEFLQQQTINSLNDPSFIKVSDNGVELSEIFKWYKEDFVSGGQTEIDFLNKFRRNPILKNSSVSYYTYNWSLNKK